MAAPSKLTVERHLTIIGHVAAGQRQAVAAGLAGVHPDSVTGWLRRGREADQKAQAAIADLDPPERLRILNLDDDPADPNDITAELLDMVDITNEGLRVWKPIAHALGHADSPLTKALLDHIPEGEEPFFRFFRALTRARGTAEAVLVRRWREAATGYEIVETTTVEEFDKAGELVSRKVTTRSRNEMDWRAADRLLQCREPEVYRPLRAATEPSADTGSSEGGGSRLEDEQAAGTKAVVRIQDHLEAIRQRRAEAESA